MKVADKMTAAREQMDIVIIGHVDHGKSTVIGRLLADTGSLPEGKLESVKEYCRKNSRPFEYAFLLDALKDEQAQGITIDSARCFFKTGKRDYIIIDAPGHIEFLKNMISGAARAEAALLVIDAKEGIKENSRRHGYLLSLLGIRKLSVLINKMDLIDYDEERYKSLVAEYSSFLNEIGVEPVSFIPISALGGENISERSTKIDWYKGFTVLEQLDDFKREQAPVDKPFRLPVQDIYKFTKDGDDRRIVAGLVETGTISTGEDVVFYPSGKRSKINTIEYFNREQFKEVGPGYTPGFTLTDQIYIKPGEIMAKASDNPLEVSNRFKANIFWMSKAPMIKDRSYKLKLASIRAVAELSEIINIVDASDLTTDSSKNQIDQFDTAECIIETTKPVAFDRFSDFAATGRFVLIDNYEIVGGGIIVDSLGQENSGLKRHIEQRDVTWDRGLVTASDRESRWNHRPKFILFTGRSDREQALYAKELEKWLFNRGYFVYYLGITSITGGLDADLKSNDIQDREEQLRRLGEVAKMFTAAGMIFITTINDVDDYDLETLKLLNSPNEILVVNSGENSFNNYRVDLNINGGEETDEVLEKIVGLLVKKDVMSDYYI